ncbi:MAG: thioredoxin domain-containing protein [Acidobacteriota bacterium]
MATLKVPVNQHDHAQGPTDAPVTLVEYGDYECPHCGRAYPIVKAVQKHFGKRLRFVFRNFPLSEIHPHAESAAEVAEAAAAQGKFWEMHDAIFENQTRLGGPLYVALAQTLHLDMPSFQDALKAREFRDRVRADFSSGVRSGVNGTPTFFINGQRHDAPFDFEDLVAAIDAAIELS